MTIRAPIWKGKVIKDVIVLDNKEGFRAFRKLLEGKEIDLILREKTAPATEDQKRYYNGVVVRDISRHTGHTKKEVQKLLKDKFGVVSTAELTTAEFREHITEVIEWAAMELDLVIPDPEKADY